MSVKIRVKNRRLYLDIYHNGVRKWEALKISLSTDKETNREILRVAEICRAKKELQILTTEWGLSDPIGGDMKLVSYMEKLNEKLYKDRLKMTHLHQAKLYLVKYPGGASIKLKQITPEWFQKIHDFLKNECGLKLASSKTYEAAIRQAIKSAYKEKLISSDPTLNIKMIKVNDPKKIFLNGDELQKLAAVKIKKEWETVKRAFLFGCNTGLRISDLIALEWGHIEQPLQIITRQQKTNELVYIPLNDTAWNIINDNKAHNAEDKIFPNLTYGDHTRIFKAWVKAAGVTKKIRWHTARHTFAVMSLENGVDVYTLSKLMGHTDVKTTQVYAKATDKMKRAAVASLPELKVN